MSDPQVSHYIEGWPRPGDFGFVAISHQEEPIGACWVRLMPANDPGFGYVAPDVPELGIGVVREARGRGSAGLSSCDRWAPVRGPWISR